MSKSTSHKRYGLYLGTMLFSFSLVLVFAFWYAVWLTSPRTITVTSLYSGEVSEFLRDSTVDNELATEGIRIESPTDFISIAEAFSDRTSPRYKELCRIGFGFETKCQLVIGLVASSSDKPLRIYTVVNAQVTSQSVVYPHYTFVTKGVGFSEGVKEGFRPSLVLFVASLPFLALLTFFVVIAGLFWYARISTS